MRDTAAHGQLPTPPRTRTQVNFRIGIKLANGLEFAKLMYVDADIAILTGKALGDRFPECWSTKLLTFYGVIEPKRELEEAMANS